MKEQHQSGLIFKCAIVRVILIGCVVLFSCGDEDDIPSNGVVEQPNGNGDVEQPVPLTGLPDETAGYENWLKLNANPIPPAGGGDPHNGTKNVYVNQERADITDQNGEQVFPYPDGTIIVKESVRPGRNFIGLIAIMQKSEGNDPAHNDWAFAEYTRGAEDKAFGKIAEGGVCWGCHIGAQNVDYVYTLLD